MKYRIQEYRDHVETVEAARMELTRLGDDNFAMFFDADGNLIGVTRNAWAIYPEKGSTS